MPPPLFPLLVLPIHRRPEDTYNVGQERSIEKAQRRVELHLPAASLEGREREWTNRRRVTWMLNDIAGYLLVGPDGVGRLAAEVHLKRRHWTNEALMRAGLGRDKRNTHDVLSFCSLNPEDPDSQDSNALAACCLALIERAEEFVRKCGKNTGQARVWRPPYPLTCIDFVGALRLSREGAERRTP